MSREQERFPCAVCVLWLEIPAKKRYTQLIPHRHFCQAKCCYFTMTKTRSFHYNLPKDFSLKDEPNNCQVSSCEFRSRPMEYVGQAPPLRSFHNSFADPVELAARAKHRATLTRHGCRYHRTHHSRNPQNAVAARTQQRRRHHLHQFRRNPRPRDQEPHASHPRLSLHQDQHSSRQHHHDHHDHVGRHSLQTRFNPSRRLPFPVRPQLRRVFLHRSQKAPPLRLLSPANLRHYDDP